MAEDITTQLSALVQWFKTQGIDATKASALMIVATAVLKAHGIDATDDVAVTIVATEDTETLQ